MPEVIIIDDEIAFANILVEVAERTGYETLVFNEAKKFLDHNKETDVIFLDLIMPDMDGVEVILELGNRKCKAQIILMSGFGKDLLHISQTLADRYHLNIIDALAKPLKITEVSQILEKIKGQL